MFDDINLFISCLAGGWNRLKDWKLHGTLPTRLWAIINVIGWCNAIYKYQPITVVSFASEVA